MQRGADGGASEFVTWVESQAQGTNGGGGAGGQHSDDGDSVKSGSEYFIYLSFVLIFLLTSH